jgi:hypothetical protein
MHRMLDQWLTHHGDRRGDAPIKEVVIADCGQIA